MKKSTKSKAATAPKVDPYLEGFMTKLLDRFASLERKMDVVISGLSAKTSVSSDPRGSLNQNLQAKERNARRERIMFEAICADCAVPCEVPFRPSEGRSVYCKDCFAKRKSGGAGPAANPGGSTMFLRSTPQQLQGQGPRVTTTPATSAPSAVAPVKQLKMKPVSKTAKKKK